MSLASSRIDLSQSGLSFGLADVDLRLERLCAERLALYLFSLEHEDLKLGDLSRLYLLPDTALPLLIDALRSGCGVESCSDVYDQMTDYVLQALRPFDPDNLPVAPAKRFAELRGNWSRGTAWKQGRGKYYPEGNNDVDVLLRNFALSEYLTLSRAEAFDTLLLSIVGHWKHQLPVPRELPHLRSLVIREGMYDISGELLRAAPELEVCIIESDEVIRDDSPLMAGLARSRVRRLVLRNMQGGDSEVKVTQALQQLKAAVSLQSVSFEHCDGLQLGPIVGFLVKRLKGLTSLSVCSSGALPVSVASTIGSCAHLTHVSLRQCAALNEAHLVALAAGCTHIRHLDLSESALDTRKLAKFAERLALDTAAATAAGSDVPTVLETLDLSGLTLNLSAVIAVMKATQSLRTLLLERATVRVRFQEEAEREAVLKKKAKNKRIGGGKKGGKGRPSTPKDKGKKKKVPEGKGKEEEGHGEEEAEIGELKKDGEGEAENGGEKKEKGKDEKKKKAFEHPADLGHLMTSVRRLYLGQSIMTDWAMAQVIAHCPLLEHLDMCDCDIQNGAGEMDDAIPPKTRARFNAVLCGADNLLGLNYKNNSVVTVAVLTRHNLRSLNCFLTSENGLLAWPVFKGPVKEGAKTWPFLESLFMPHPLKFFFGGCRPQHLTTLVISTASKFPNLTSLKTLKLVCLMGADMQYMNDDCDFAPLKTVPHLVLHGCVLRVMCWLDLLGLPRDRRDPALGQPLEEIEPDRRALLWSQPDWKLKRVSFYQCITHEADPEESDIVTTLIEPARWKKYEETCMRYKAGERNVTSEGVRGTTWSPRVVHFLRTCVPFVSHSLISSPAEFAALFPPQTEHPDKPHAEPRPGFAWHYGKVLAAAELNPNRLYRFNWYGDE